MAWDVLGWALCLAGQAFLLIQPGHIAISTMSMLIKRMMATRPVIKNQGYVQNQNEGSSEHSERKERQDESQSHFEQIYSTLRNRHGKIEFN